MGYLAKSSTAKGLENIDLAGNRIDMLLSRVCFTDHIG